MSPADKPCCEQKNDLEILLLIHVVLAISASYFWRGLPCFVIFSSSELHNSILFILPADLCFFSLTIASNLHVIYHTLFNETLPATKITTDFIIPLFSGCWHKTDDEEAYSEHSVSFQGDSWTGLLREFQQPRRPSCVSGVPQC